MKFNFDWLKSKERLELEQLRKEKIERQHVIDLGLIKDYRQVDLTPKPYPYRSVRLIDQLVLVVLNDGSTLSNSTGGQDFFIRVKQCKTEEEILLLFARDMKFSKQDEDVNDRKLINQNLRVIEESKDFEVTGEDVFIKGLSMPLSPVIIAAFIELLEKRGGGDHYEQLELEEEYKALRMFTLKLALNPIQSSREDCLTFIRENDIRITATGNLVAYRGIYTTGKKDKKLSNFISTEYFKIKKWKKSPINYEVWKNGDILRCSKEVHITAWGEKLGNLQNLYDSIGDMEENTYTDGYTRKMKIKVGEVYSIPEEEVDIDSRQDCSNGLHVGSRSFAIGSFGDTKVLVLVNPSKVRSVPYSEGNKMRVSEMFIACILEVNSKGEYMDTDVDLVHLDEDYHNYSIEELQDALAGKKFLEAITCQQEQAPVTKVDMQKITDMLILRVKNVK